MFTAYIDDSGTALDQKVASATALIIPASRLPAFHSEWETFSEKWGVKDFHASECAVGNRKSDFAGWDEAKINKVFQRIRQIILRHGAKAYSLSVHKEDYDAAVPPTARQIMGLHHYTYAIQNLLQVIDEWAGKSGKQYPVEYVFDWLDPKTQKAERNEIEQALATAERAKPSRFIDHYSFRHRADVPGLQCVDLVAWTCYRFGLWTFAQTPLTPLQSECWADFNGKEGTSWLTSVGQTPKQISEAVAVLEGLDMSRPFQIRPTLPGMKPFYADRGKLS